MQFIERKLRKTPGSNQREPSFIESIVLRRNEVSPISSLARIDPFDLPDMHKAIDILKPAAEQNKTVVCVVDYDTDGVCSGSILREGLSALGCYTGVLVTDRYSDGYGFSYGACDKILEMDELPDVLLTADLGSSDGEQIQRFQKEAKKRGKDVKVIVTDHHHISKTTPPSTADAFINPGRQDVFHLFDHNICGASVAWMLVNALHKSLSKPRFEPKSLIDLACVATVGDMVSLSDPVNRVIVSEGLKLINSDNARVTWKLFKKTLGKGQIFEEDLAFQVVPRINALSRMGDDEQNALTWLGSNEEPVVEAAFTNMNLNNEERKTEQVECQKEALLQAVKQKQSGKFICLCYVPEFSHGVVGLAAAHVVKETGLPAIVISVKDSGELTASARSIPGFDLRLAIEKAQDATGLLTKFGGHPMAAGFSMRKKDDIEPFADAINHIAKDMLQKKQPEPLFYHDGILPPEMKTVEGFIHSRDIGPFGQDYPAPTYLFKGLLTKVRLMGKEEQHAKLVFSNGDEVVWFNHEGKANAMLTKIVELVVTPSLNEFRGKKSVQFIAQAAKVAS